MPDETTIPIISVPALAASQSYTYVPTDYASSSNTTVQWASGVTSGGSIYNSPSATYLPQSVQPLYVQQVTVFQPEIVAACPKCKKVRPLPQGYAVIEGISYGHCGHCGAELIRLSCSRANEAFPPNAVRCHEPLHQGERYCRTCGKENLEQLIEFGLIDDPALIREVAARGNMEDPGSVFRGVRET